MSKLQRGFGAVEAILVVVIVGLIGFIGWRLYDAQKQSEQQAASVDQSTIQHENKQTTKEYTNQEPHYKFAYPVDWKETNLLAQQNSSNRAVHYSATIQSPDLETSEEGVGFHFAKGTALFVTVQATTAKTVADYFAGNNFLQNVAKNKQDVSVEGNAAVKYTLNYETIYEVSTILVKNGSLYSISMQASDDTTRDHYLSEYDAFVKSFKLL